MRVGDKPETDVAHIYQAWASALLVLRSWAMPHALIAERATSKIALAFLFSHEANIPPWGWG